MNKWEDCENCGGSRFVAEQAMETRTRDDGRKENLLGPERVYCKSCGAPAVEKKAEDGGEPEVLIGIPKHLQTSFDETDENE